MKLLRKNPDGTIEVLQTEYQLRGVLDAFGVAKTLGDGEYIADMLDGTFLPFKIVDGQEPQGGVDLGDVEYGQPYQQTADGARFRDKDASAFPSLVPDVAGTDVQGGQAYDEYVPANQRG